MAGPRREMRDVELVEADALDDAVAVPATEQPATDQPAADEPPHAAAASPRSVRGRRRANAVALAVVVTLLGVGGTVLADRREDARLRSIAGLADIVAPLDGPVVPLWRGRGWTGSDLRDVGGRLVGMVSTPYGDVDVVALDPRTGADVWRTPVAPVSVPDLWTSCVVPGAPYPTLPPGPRPVAVCVAVDRTATIEKVALGTLTYPIRARLVVVDAVDGAVLSDVPTPATSQVVAVGTDVVLGHVGPDGRARVARVDPRTGAERWSFTTPGPVPADGFEQRSLGLQAAGDVVAVEAGATWVLAADGEVLRTWPGPRPPGESTPVDLRAGGRVLARATVMADGGWGTEVVDLAAGAAWSAPGFPVRARPDDGSLDDLVLLQADGSPTVRAHDRSSGEPRWSAELPYSVPLAVLDGRLLAAQGGVLRALDGRTGAPLWTTVLDRAVQGAVVSDGRVVVVSRSAAEGGGVLAAVGLDDGRRRWATAVEHALFLFAVDGRLYGWSARGLQALGEPAGG